MNKLILSISSALIAGCVIAAEAADKAPSPEEIKAMRAERRVKAMNETGGFIADHRTANGCFVFVNAQKLVGEEVVDTASRLCQNSCLVIAKVVKGEKVDLAGANAAFRKLNANMAVFLVEDADLPMTVQCPESRWAIINVAALARDGADKQTVEIRVRKMMSRTFAMMFQAGYSVSPRSTVQVIDKPSDLDRIPGEGVATDCQTVVQQIAPKFGFKVMKRVFYRKALEEGWAPEPTTEIQRNCKRLWEQERRGEPTAALKIQYDKKSGGTVK